MKRFLTYSLLFLLVLVLVGCGKCVHKWDQGQVTKEATCTEDGVKTFTCEKCGETKTEVIKSKGHDYLDGVCTVCGEKDPEAKVLEYADNTELRLAVAHNSTATTITFQDESVVGDGLLLADGKTYVKNDLKPVWAELEKILKVKFNNVYTGASSAANEYKAWRTDNFEGVDIVVGNASDMAADGKVGKIVDLSQWLDYMPNFKRFLKNNPIVYLSLLSDTETGAIYYAPYFDGYDDIEKYFLMRIDWLQTLLDGETYAPAQDDTFAEVSGQAAVYTPYMPTTGTVKVDGLSSDGKTVIEITKNYNTKYGNIAEWMNNKINDTHGAVTGTELVVAFREYIDLAYNGLYGTKRSDLFAGYSAAWDVDELVALLRCVITNSFGLTGQEDNKVTGIFPREKTLDRTSDLFKMMSMFGVRGVESRNDYLYFNAEGKLADARGDVAYAEAVAKMNQLYEEGLILNEFDTQAEAKINVNMFRNNLGFMMYDYVQTQTVYNEDSATKAKCAEFKLSAVMNPVAKWYDGSDANGVYMRFTESWRSVKTNGWCIPTTCTGDRLQAALKLFDYMYSKEGQELMSYGPAAWRSGNTTLYKGNQIPELSAAAIDELWRLGKGSYTDYARKFLGSTLPIGFVKDQGMEYQCTTEGGKEGAAIVSAAIAAGTIKHVSPEISSNLFYTMVPTVLPTTAEQDTLISGYAALGASGLFSTSKNKYNIYTDILKYGYGSEHALTTAFTWTPASGTEVKIENVPASADAWVNQFKSQLGGNEYLTVRTAAWMKLKAYYDTNIAK